MFLQIAIGAIGIGIVIMIGYLLVAQVRVALPTPQVENDCYGVPSDNESAYPNCFGEDNTSEYINDSDFVSGVDSTQTTIFSGLGLIAVGIIVLAAFGLINVFK